MIPSNTISFWLMRWPARLGCLLPLWCLGFVPALQSQPALEGMPAAEPSAQLPELALVKTAKPDSELPLILKRHESVTITNGEVAGSIIVMDGDVDVQGEVRGGILVIGGNIKVSGTVREGLVAVMGNVSVEPQGRLRQPAVVLGGDLEVDKEARVRPKNLVLPATWFSPVKGAVQWVKDGLFLMRPLPPRVNWAWYIAFTCVAIYAGLLFLLPRPARACMTALVDRPVLSYFLGLLALLAMLFLVPALLFFALTGVGFLLLLLLTACVGVALGFARIGVLQFLGHQMARVGGGNLMSRPWIAFVLGIVLTCLLYMVPIVGAFVWVALFPLTVGGLILAAYRGVVPVSVPSISQVEEADTSAQSKTSGPAQTPPSFQSVPPASGPAPSSASSFASVPPPISGESVRSAPTLLDAMEVRPAGFWIRFFATLLDVILVSILMSISQLEGARAFLLLLMVYHITFWGWWGTTLGGRILGIRLLQSNGSAPTLGVATVRCLAAFFSAIPLFLGFVWAGWSSRKESWHDRLTGTRMIRS